MKELTAFIIAFLWCASTAAQLTLRKVEGLPAREVFDLHFDRKGYLWISHDLGLSRYDGAHFTHYRNNDAVSLKMTDIVEDRQGRIWCHNLSGQVFFIENNQLKRFSRYAYEQESQYPRMVICEDELLITSNKGLFVYNTTNDRSRFYKKKEAAGTGVESITVTGSRALMLNNDQWYLYSAAQGLQKVAADKRLVIDATEENILQPQSLSDTIFLVSNPSGTVRKIFLNKNQVSLAGTIETGDYINSVSAGQQVWINTRNKSISPEENTLLTGYSISEVVYDQKGNPWIGSLKHGLLTTFSTSHWNVAPPKDPDDYLKTLNYTGGYLFSGTQRGNLLMIDPDEKIVWEHRLFDGFGSIEMVKDINNGWYIVGASIGTYLVNPQKKIVNTLLRSKTIADADAHGNMIFLAAADGVYLMPFLETGSTLTQWKQDVRRLFPFIQTHDHTNVYKISNTRSRAVRYHGSTGKLFISFKHGLYEADMKGLHQITFGGKTVHATSLWFSGSSLIIATLNDGLFIREKESNRHFTIENELFSNNLLRTKVTGNFLWLFEQDAIQLFDISTKQFVQQIILPPLGGPDVFDVAVVQGEGLLTTEHGIYKVPLSPTAHKMYPIGYLDQVIINNKDTVLHGGSAFDHTSTDLQFFLSAPVFSSSGPVVFKYRLSGIDDKWHFTESGERMIRYATLSPGNYRFEAMAIEKNGLQQKEMIVFDFSIRYPWWKQGWFLLLAVVTGILMLYLLYRFRVKQLLKVEMVRQEIARDLHDDIGATLSSINIYSSLLKKQTGENTYLSLIQQHATEVVTKLDDLVWSIHPRNDSVEELIRRMQLFADPLLKAAGIQYQWTVDEFRSVKMSVQMKRHCYLTFKELINNLVKHSQCSYCWIRISRDHGQMKLDIFDDGIDVNNSLKQTGNGLQNISSRVSQMNGWLEVNSNELNENHLHLSIPIQ